MRRYLEDLVGGEFPRRDNIRVQGIAEIEGGWETAVYGFSLVYDEDGVSHSADLVARFYPGLRGGERAAREASVLRALARARIPVPAVELESTQPSRHGSGVVVMQRIPGVLLTVELAGSVGLAAEMARCLVALHRLPIAAVFSGGLAPFETPGFVAADPEAIAATVAHFGLVDFGPLVDRLAQRIPDEYPPSILHNDYHPENIIVGDGGLVVIDWTFAGTGDYRLDLAWSAMWTGAMAGSQARAELVAGYEEAAHRAIDDLEYFETLKLGARLMTIALWLDGAVEPPVPKLTPEVIVGDYKPTLMTVYERFRELTGIELRLFDQM
ncbi:MAG: hypothetical protein BMS9Abin07_0326 [Acidimicrobiia bacterium]|nr:MAG: hypothetical protein BMS9Abin07_0326 [Acidimicrobiia bacterium]